MSLTTIHADISLLTRVNADDLGRLLVAAIMDVLADGEDVAADES